MAQVRRSSRKNSRVSIRWTFVYLRRSSSPTEAITVSGEIARDCTRKTCQEESAAICTSPLFLWGLDERQDRRRKNLACPGTSSRAASRLISIVRSAAAWDVVAEVGDPEARRSQGSLRALRAEVEKAFPGARPFKRPGFDDRESEMR
jgi:hypothetical protein